MSIDTTTIDIEKLERLCPEVQLPPSYYLQAAPGGNGCFGDPPGYPSYFTRSVYTPHGNSPSRGTDMALLGRALPNYDYPDGAKLKGLLRAVYQPLPVDHPRAVAWIRNQFRHSAHCYQIPKELSRDGLGTLMVWPIPDYELRSFRDDPRFSDAWREQSRAEVDAWNREQTEMLRPYAVPSCHRAVLAVREFYPDFSDAEAEAMIASPPTEISHWWERHAAPPAPGRCPGDMQVHRPHSDKFCQFCGGLGNLPTVANTEDEKGA